MQDTKTVYRIFHSSFFFLLLSSLVASHKELRLYQRNARSQFRKRNNPSENGSLFYKTPTLASTANGSTPNAFIKTKTLRRLTSISVNDCREVDPQKGKRDGRWGGTFQIERGVAMDWMNECEMKRNECQSSIRATDRKGRFLFFLSFFFSLSLRSRSRNVF